MSAADPIAVTPLRLLAAAAVALADERAEAEATGRDAFRAEFMAALIMKNIDVYSIERAARFAAAVAGLGVVDQELEPPGCRRDDRGTLCRDGWGRAAWCSDCPPAVTS